MNIPDSCLSNLLHCTVCTEEYNETTRRPKLLHCGHTFCMLCLYELVNQALQQKVNENCVILRCPSCRQTTTVFDVCCVSKLSDNFAIINFFNYHRDEDLKTFCKKHNDEKFKFFCDECQRLLCPSCGLQHVTKKLHNVEKAESAAVKYRQQIHLAMMGCKEKLIHLDEIIQEATDEKLKLESLQKSLEHLATSADDLEVLSQKHILKQLRDCVSIATKPQSLVKKVSGSHRRHLNKQNALEPPGYWCSTSPADAPQQ